MVSSFTLQLLLSLPLKYPVPILDMVVKKTILKTLLVIKT
jgi:hypothetical protein